MSLVDELKNLAEDLSATWRQRGKDRYIMRKTLAERKVLLAKKKLVYTATFRLKERKNELIFSERLTETSGGLIGMMGSDCKLESWNTLSGAREGSIEQQSTLFGKRYDYTFNYGRIREQVQEICERHGYHFQYRIF